MRPRLGDAICGVVNGHPSDFSGPFGALSENFIQQLVAVYRRQNWTCSSVVSCIGGAFSVISNAYLSTKSVLPLHVTFERCLSRRLDRWLNASPKTTGHTTRVAILRSCNSAKGQVSDETLFKTMTKYSLTILLSRSWEGLYPASSVKPSACPNFRDKGYRELVDGSCP